MEVTYKKSFIRDFNKIKNKEDQEIIHQLCFQEIPETSKPSEISNLKKIKGYDHYYRIRKGDYRIGIKYDDEKITFMRVLRRDSIYKYFP